MYKLIALAFVLVYRKFATIDKRKLTDCVTTLWENNNVTFLT